MFCLPQEYVQQHQLEVPIEVETRTLEELKQLLALLKDDASIRVDRVMLDNMTRLDASKPGEGPSTDYTKVAGLASCARTPASWVRAGGECTYQGVAGLD